jgi:hypothetical protein
MCDFPDVTSAEVKVGFRIRDYGPREAKVGQTFNVQPDGASAAWFKLDDEVDGSEIRVHFGDMTLVGTVSGDVVTVKVPKGAYSKAGKAPVVLEKSDGMSISKSNTVIIDLENP